MISPSQLEHKDHHQRIFTVLVGCLMVAGWVSDEIVHIRMNGSPPINAKDCPMYEINETNAQCKARLPRRVYDLGIRLGVTPGDKPDGIKLTQKGRMRRRLDAESWMPFTASQTISTQACEFNWLANAGPFGMISARDALEEGEGLLDVTALGLIPIARTPHTPALVRGELMRYLAELAWAPSAIFFNTSLQWREEDSDTLVVNTGSGEKACEVTLTLNQEGRIASAFSPNRPRSATPPILPTPWRGRFYNYKLHNNIWLPFGAEVAWELQGKEVVYWQGNIQSWETFGVGVTHQG